MTTHGFCIHKSPMQMNIHNQSAFSQYTPNEEKKIKQKPVLEHSSNVPYRGSPRTPKIQEKILKQIIIKPQKINQDNFSKYGQIINTNHNIQNYEDITNSQVSNIFESQIQNCYKSKFNFSIIKLKKQKFVDFDGTTYSDKNDQHLGTGKGRSKSLYFDRLIHYDFNDVYLGSLQKCNWYIGVANGEHPDPLNVQVFQLNEKQFIKLNSETWHTCPLFLDRKYLDFFVLVNFQNNFKKSYVYLIDPTPTLFNIQI